MKLLAIGDPHYTVTNQCDTTAFEKGVAKLIAEHRPEIVVVLGDVLDTHDKYHVDPFVRSINFIRMLRTSIDEYGGCLAVLIGNHDRPNNSDFLSGKHPFVGFDSNSDQFVIADSVMKIPFEKFTLICVPYVPPGRFQEALDTIDWPEGPVLIAAHQEFMGAKMGVIKSMAGDEWGLDQPPVISGHIHDHQRLQENIVYIGTPFQKTYAESVNRTVSIFDLTDFDGSHGVLDTEQRIRVPGVVKKHIIRITTSDLTQFEIPRGKDDLYRVYVSGTTQELAAAKKHPRFVEMTKISNINIKCVCTAVTRSKNEELEIETVTKSFGSRLLDRVQNDPRLTKLIIDLGIS